MTLAGAPAKLLMIEAEEIPSAEWDWTRGVFNSALADLARLGGKVVS